MFSLITILLNEVFLCYLAVNRLTGHYISIKIFSIFKNNLRKLKQCLACKKFELANTVNDLFSLFVHTLPVL